MNNATVQAAIGAYVNYTEQSIAVASAFNTTGDDGRLDGTTTDVLALVNQGVIVRIPPSRITAMSYPSTGHNGLRRCRLQQYIRLLIPAAIYRPNKLTKAPGNWLGGEAVYDSIRVPGLSTPGYVNISTSDLIVHGQAKQSGTFTFARIYDSGHEVPYYQPLTALAIFERAINGYDVATGQSQVDREYVTVGPAHSTYREGNATVKFALVENGAETIVDASTYDRVLQGESAPSRKLLAELVAKPIPKPNATAYGNSFEGLKEHEEETEPIHLRKRGGKVRGEGLMRDDVTGGGFLRRGVA